jgi:type II secretory pathway component PulL
LVVFIEVGEDGGEQFEPVSFGKRLRVLILPKDLETLEVLEFSSSREEIRVKRRLRDFERFVEGLERST